jgi:glucosyl-3-phosphoglycerate synthase
VTYVKGCYTRPLQLAGQELPAGGGRVTELTARPLLNALWPELAGFVQPLGGEYAGRRSALEQVPFLSGYGVEVGLLIDLLGLGGLGSLAQVDLGVRRHTSQSEEALGAMAGEVVSAVLSRSPLDVSGLLTRFQNDGAGFVPRSSAVAVDERPPMIEIPEYRSLRAGMVG